MLSEIRSSSVSSSERRDFDSRGGFIGTTAANRGMFPAGSLGGNFDHPAPEVNFVLFGHHDGVTHFDPHSQRLDLAGNSTVHLIDDEAVTQAGVLFRNVDARRLDTEFGHQFRCRSFDRFAANDWADSYTDSRKVTDFFPNIANLQNRRDA
jgi:hypothetical protein